MDVHVTLSCGTVILIDEESLPLVRTYRWRLNCRYVRCTQKGDDGRWIGMLHRVLMGNPNATVDHANGDRLDNRLCNLRLATRSQQCANRRGWTAKGGGYKGVIHEPGRERPWVARIGSGRKYRRIGRFATAIEAAVAYNAAALIEFGEFARLNEVAA